MFLKQEIENEKEPDLKILDEFEKLYDLSKSFYQGNSYKCENPSENDKKNTPAEDEKEQKTREDPYEAVNHKTGGDTGWPGDDVEMQQDSSNPPSSSTDLLNLKDYEMEENDPPSSEVVQQTGDLTVMKILNIIQNGTTVDWLKYEPGFDEVVDGVWCRANLQLIIDKYSFKVKFLRESSEYDRILRIEDFDMHIVQDWTKSGAEEEWRTQMMKNSESNPIYVDYYCSGYGWWEAMVMGSMTSVDGNIEQVYLKVNKVPLGMSTSHESFKEEEFNQISIRSPRIRMRGTFYDARTPEEIELQEMNKPDITPVGPCSQRQSK